MNGSLPRSSTGRRYRILLVEDDGNDVELIQRAFKQINPSVVLHVAYNGQEAIDHLIATASNGAAPELILTDIKMPIMDGFEFLNWLKTKSPHRRTPVVMVSSSVVETDVARAYDLGAAGYLVKPTTFEELSSQVEALMVFWSISQLPPPWSEENFAGRP